ncbi:MAG: transporter substrate-binding domain-containing protein [Oscillospiraceae bacterium]|jgi:ABC-type amino acid transport substrate-binding protein|nr:transporter substrate-binding domain-containing protein [Oscillospiraceae bacterium]
MKKLLAVILTFTLAVIPVFSLSGCSKPEDTAPVSGGAEIRKISVVGYTANKPFVYLDEDGTLTGYEPAVLRAIDELLPQYEFSYEGMDFAAMPVALESGAAQIAVCMLVKSEERLKRFIFPNNPSTLSPMNFIIKEGRTDIQTFDDIGGKRVITTNSGYEYTHMVKWNENHPGNEIIFDFYNETNSDDTYPKILADKADAILTYPAGFEYNVTEKGYTGLALSPVVFVEDTYYMIAQSETQLRDDIDGALEQLLADGTLRQLSEEWLGEDVFAVYGGIFASQGEWQEAKK